MQLCHCKWSYGDIYTSWFLPTLIGYWELDCIGYNLIRSPARPPGSPASVGPCLMGFLQSSIPIHWEIVAVKQNINIFFVVPSDNYCRHEVLFGRCWCRSLGHKAALYYLCRSAYHMSKIIIIISLLDSRKIFCFLHWKTACRHCWWQ